MLSIPPLKTMSPSLTGMLCASQVFTPAQRHHSRTRYEVVVSSKPEVTLGLPAYRRSIMVVLSPRFIIANQLNERLTFAQARTKVQAGKESFITLAPFPAAMMHAAAGEHKPFQWHDDSTPSYLCLKTKDCQWSGAFDISKVGAFAIKLRSSRDTRPQLLRVEVKQDTSNGSVFVIVGYESSEFPVYVLLPCVLCRLRAPCMHVCACSDALPIHVTLARPHVPRLCIAGTASLTNLMTRSCFNKRVSGPGDMLQSNSALIQAPGMSCHVSIAALLGLSDVLLLLWWADAATCASHLDNLGAQVCLG